MKGKKKSPGRRTLEEAHKAFSAWRKSRNGKTAIPEYLWEKAVKLSHEYSVSHISKVLDLNQSTLKKRFQAQLEQSLSSFQPSFVELGTRQYTKAQGNIIELESPHGFKMRIQMQEENSKLLLELGKQFMGEAR